VDDDAERYALLRLADNTARTMETLERTALKTRSVASATLIAILIFSALNVLVAFTKPAIDATRLVRELRASGAVTSPVVADAQRCMAASMSVLQALRVALADAELSPLESRQLASLASDQQLCNVVNYDPVRPWGSGDERAVE
jgi:hypothetical protein